MREQSSTKFFPSTSLLLMAAAAAALAGGLLFMSSASLPKSLSLSYSSAYLTPSLWTNGLSPQEGSVFAAVYEHLYLEFAPRPAFTYEPRPGLVRVGLDIIEGASNSHFASWETNYDVFDFAVRLSSNAGRLLQVHLAGSNGDEENRFSGPGTDELLRNVFEAFEGVLEHVEHDLGLSEMYDEPVHVLRVLGLSSVSSDDEAIEDEDDLMVLEKLHEKLYECPSVVWYIQLGTSHPEEDRGVPTGTPITDEAKNPLEWAIGADGTRQTVNAIGLHAEGVTGEGVVVHLADDAFDTTHPQLLGRNLAEKNQNFFVPYQQTDIFRDVNVDWSDPSYAKETHGMGVAIAVAGVGECSRGVAPGAGWVGSRVLRSDDDVDVPRATPYGTAVVRAMENNAEIAIVHSNSHKFGGYNSKDEILYHRSKFPNLKRALNKIADNNGLVTWSAGNDPYVSASMNNGVVHPTIALVGAAMPDGIAASYSAAAWGAVLVGAPAGTSGTSGSRPHSLDVSGPHGVGPGDCREFSGTSCAAPMVAGVVALVQSAVDRPLTTREMLLVLADSAGFILSNEERASRSYEPPTLPVAPPRTQGYDTNLGWGIPDAEKAVALGREIASNPIEFYPDIKASFRPKNGGRLTGDTTERLLIGEVSVDAPADALVQYVTFSMRIQHREMQELSIQAVNSIGTPCQVFGEVTPALGEWYKDNFFDFTTICHTWLGAPATGDYTLTGLDGGDLQYHTSTSPAGPAIVLNAKMTMYTYKRPSGLTTAVFIAGSAAVVLGAGATVGMRQRRKSKTIKNMVKVKKADGKAMGLNADDPRQKKLAAGAGAGAGAGADGSEAEKHGLLTDMESKSSVRAASEPGAADMLSKGSRSSRASSGKRKKKGRRSKSGRSKSPNPSKGSRGSTGKRSRGSRGN